MSTHVIALVLTWAGVVVTVVACVTGAIAVDSLPRLHFVTMTTSLGVPLAGLGLVVENGLNLTSASIVLVVVVLAASGPAASAAVGRTTAQREGLIPAEEPE